MHRSKDSLSDNCVYVAQTRDTGYNSLPDKAPIDLPKNVPVTTAFCLLRKLFRDAQLDSVHYDTAEWNPLGDLIRPGANVVLKPNWVLNDNKRRHGVRDCLVSHPSVIEAVLHYVVKTGPSHIVVGDAPLQSCDFEKLRNECGLDDMIGRYRRQGHDIQICDFRLTKQKGLYRNKIQVEADFDKYCEFDLGQQSWLTPVTNDQTEFRVTQYDPDVLQKHHQPGSHQYLIARQVMDADVVINLPKLKTHQKAGMTGALKNVVGINGFKEYLPHHRKGGSSAGGDCYCGDGWLKRIAEEALDRANRAKSPLLRYANARFAAAALLESRLLKGDRNLEGAWHGNDTVWRMCLDLQRILHYGMIDGKLSDCPQRKVLTITDAIIAGDGDGPLAPKPVPLGVLSLGNNVAAVEWVHCLLMRLDPRKIPLVANAFLGDPWPLADFSAADVRVHINGKVLLEPKNVVAFGRPFRPPVGWRGYCELDDSWM